MEHQNQNVINVLQSHVILQQIFPHLNLSDLKSCRLICRKWEEVSRPYFIKKAVCCIRKTKSVTRDLQLFEHTFCDTTELPLVPFRRIRFEGEFRETDLQRFFTDRPFIKELTLNAFSVTNGAGIHKRFDISKWSGLSLTALAIKNNKKGCVVPLNYIGDIKKLKLTLVTLVLNGRVSPEYLRMCDVTLDCGDGKRWNSENVLTINDYFEVENLKKAKLFDDLYLDLTHCRQLEHLSLDGKAKVVGLHRELILKRLDIYNYEVGIKLSDLPPSVKHLNVACPLFTNTNVKCLPTDIFPNVKSLGLFQNCKLLTQCRNLVRLEVHFVFVLDLRTLPRSMKVIKCTNKGKLMLSDNLEHSDGFELEKLIYENDLTFNSEDMPGNITSLKPKIVVFNCLPVTSYIANVCGVCDCLEDHVFPVVQQQIQRGGTFILGGVSTAGRRFCQCSGPFPTTLFHEKGHYIKCSPDSKGKMNTTSISKKDFDAFVNDY